MTTKRGPLAVLALAFSATAALAQGHHRHHHVYRGAQPYYYYGGNAEANTVALATERAQHEPGVTSELAPDSRQTATGGPVGGVPGFSGEVKFALAHLSERGRRTCMPAPFSLSPRICMLDNEPSSATIRLSKIALLLRRTIAHDPIFMV